MDSKEATNKLNSLQTRIDSLKNRKVAITTERDILKKQYDEKVVELSELGIKDLSTLSSTIESLEKELQEEIESIETIVTDIEAKLDA